MIKARDATRRLTNGRIHVVLIPGFAGFDSLGQLEYYAGVTPLFHDWRQRHPDRATPVLHYFDNFPTAAVATRAERLRRYLAKRIARGEFSGNDGIALVGHSTGGLDIRLLLWRLAHPVQAIPIDGGRGKDMAVDVDPAEILRRVKRVVFLSVPQWGTNIADWLGTYDTGCRMVVDGLEAAVTASQVPLVDTLERRIGGAAAKFAATDLMFAVQDALREAEADTHRDAFGTAEAQEAAFLMELWLRHMATDFRAIDDLAAASPHDHSSPAHFTCERREQERSFWKLRRIKTMSFATIGKNPFNFNQDPMPRWDPLRPWTYLEYSKEEEQAAGTDLLYRLCYRATAGGPFRHPPDLVKLAARELQSRKEREIALWDNDGIVNTASMLWPNPKETRLVNGDHMDIVGHYRRVRAVKGSDRKFQAYDLLKSNSGFTAATFQAVWTAVFNFCVPAKTQRLRTAA